MSAISKLFDGDYKYVPCEVILHPGMACSRFFFHSLLHSLSSNVKFFLPITLIPFLLRIRRADRRKLLKDYILYFAEVTLAAYLIGNTITTSICLFRRLLGRHTTVTISFLPGFLAGLWSFALSDRTARFFYISIAQIMLHTYLLNFRSPLTRVLQRSKSIQTFIFMACSALIMQAIRQYKLKIFWFVVPPPVQQKNREKTQTKLSSEAARCTHKATCQSYILNGIKEYFLFAFVLENTKILVKKMKHTKSISDYFRHINFHVISFFVSYIGLYRLSMCLLKRYSRIDDEVVHLLAGYLGGVSFAFYPKKAFLAYAIVILCETTWRTQQHNQKKYSKLTQNILKLPWGRASLSVSLALLVYAFLFHQQSLNSIGRQIVNAATNSKGNQVLEHIGEMLKTLNIQ